MRTPTFVLSAGILSASLLAAGCGAQDDLDLSSLPVVSEDDKADMVAGTSALIWTRPSTSMAQCVRAPCPTHMLADVNSANTRLAYAYDWRALKLSKADQDSAEANAGKMLLYGRYTPAKALGEPVLVYQVSRAHMRVSERSTDHPDTDRYYSTNAAQDNCPQGQCTALVARPLNQKSAPPENWPGVDFTRLEISANAAAQLQRELSQGKAYVGVVNQVQLFHNAPISQVFRPLQAPPLAP